VLQPAGAAPSLSITRVKSDCSAGRTPSYSESTARPAPVDPRSESATGLVALRGRVAERATRSRRWRLRRARARSWCESSRATAHCHCRRERVHHGRPLPRPRSTRRRRELPCARTLRHPSRRKRAATGVGMGRRGGMGERSFHVGAQGQTRTAEARAHRTDRDRERARDLRVIPSLQLAQHKGARYGSGSAPSARSNAQRWDLIEAPRALICNSIASLKRPH
jgi:hypothetical protein